jgi:hypothetical protein
MEEAKGKLKIALQDAIDWVEDDGVQTGDTYEVEKILATRKEGVRGFV